MIFWYMHDNVHAQTHINEFSIFWKLALNTIFQKKKKNDRDNKDAN